MIKFPLKEGKKWDAHEKVKFKIASLKATVQIPAGMFSSCIKVTSRAGVVYYYAPGAGIVKQRSQVRRNNRASESERCPLWESALKYLTKLLICLMLVEDTMYQWDLIFTMTDK
ncbi:hypothetical protein [Metabacillus fastidiosus]|uniref:hypothetical protein n=1 Tax=Metabacillus fastidiosus TaxID=1458 RepID=UPI003D2892AC